MNFPIFLSLVLIVRNQSASLEALLRGIGRQVAGIVDDYEIVVVDNASSDDSVATLERLSRVDGVDNLQVYALIKEVDTDTASWAGLESALGDYVVVIDPTSDDIGFLPSMLESAVSGSDVVFAKNTEQPRGSLAYRMAFATYNGLYRWFNGVDLAREAPQYRVMSRRVINYILQHPNPSLSYRHLPATGGFAKANLTYSAKPSSLRPKSLMHGIDRGMRLLVSTTRGPMRMVTMLSLFGAISNVVYSVYVIAVGLFKADVAPGWVTLSLQQSGMFLLISLVLLVLGEYILQMTSLSNEGPPYHVAREFTSAVMTRRQKLNVEDVKPGSRTDTVTASRAG
jgi:hypothetical protein